MIEVQQLRLPPDYTGETLIALAEKELRVPAAQIERVTLKKRSIDARKKNDIHYTATLAVETKREREILKKCCRPNIVLSADVPYRYPEAGSEALFERPLIAGCGPAGLFCGLILAEMGYRPLILERGKDAETRAADVERFWREGVLDPQSNVQFGEGGAGTFSDGKLNTLVKDRMGRNRLVLETFVRAGAPEDILYVNKPHIGTDMLRTVVQNMRRRIEELGGEVRFESQVTDLTEKDGRLRAVTVNGRETIAASVLVLAIGHSARDTFAMLAKKPLRMEEKAFAVGLRIQHPQAMIDEAQYGPDAPAYLPAADYKLTAKLKNQRGAYSFCMCPGGYVVNASSEKEALAVNGMSYRKRDAQNANSALVVTVTPQDFGARGVLGGVEFQRRLERLAWRAGNGKIPLQLYEDFQKNRSSKRLGDVQPCMKGEWQFANLREALPGFLGESLLEGMQLFSQKIKGFDRPDALLCGVESRTSSPVRIVRGEDLSSDLDGVYPCGEGAGYAGGITSAAMDGIRTAEAIVSRFARPARKF